MGVPSCPAGLTPEGETCVVACPEGQAASADTSGHCCWPNQVWATSRSVCVGVPTCPAPLVAQGEACVAPPPPAPAPPQPAVVSPPPPQVRGPPPPAVAAPDASAVLKAKLVELKAQRDKTSVVGGIIALAVGVPLTVVAALLLPGAESDGIGALYVTGIVLGVGCTIGGIIEIPSAASRRAKLNREIRDTEAQLRGLQAWSRPQGMLFALALPVVTF